MNTILKTEINRMQSGLVTDWSIRLRVKRGISAPIDYGQMQLWEVINKSNKHKGHRRILSGVIHGYFIKKVDRLTDDHPVSYAIV